MSAEYNNEITMSTALRQYKHFVSDIWIGLLKFYESKDTSTPSLHELTLKKFMKMKLTREPKEFYETQ